MAEKKNVTAKESGKKIMDLKIELLKNPTKKKSIKKEIARLLTMAREQSVPLKGKNQTKLDGESK
jgi:ribosomal protein L29